MRVRADGNESFYSYSSFNSPPTIYRFATDTGGSTVFKTVKVDFDPTDYIVKQVFFDSKDSTKVPMFIAHRAVPGHSFKYAARLQETQAGKAPVMIRIETRAGHGSGKPTDLIIGEIVDEWAFLADNLDLELPESYGDSE
jgi:prolyl oligopeptidase PreP (S9A serine peptidase family)